MSIISNEDFLQEQAWLGSGYSYLVQISNLMYSGLHLVVDTQDIDVEVDLLGPFNTNLNAVNPGSTYNLLRTATQALERHITSRSGQTFNDWLYTQEPPLQVSPDFATLSGLTGTPIAPQNIA